MRAILNARLIAQKAVPLTLALRLTTVGKYAALYRGMKAYYVAIKYRVSRENRTIRNGINYRLYVVGNENGQWTIVAASEAPVRRVIEAGYGFGTPEEEAAIRLQEERWKRTE